MKNALKLFALAFILATMFSVASCHRNTPDPVVANVVYAETASIAQEEAQSVFDEIESISEVTNDSNQAATVTLLPESVEAVAARFAPLADNERFAFSLENIRPAGGLHNIWNMTVYAVKDNVNNVSELFTWDDVNRRNSIQFTSDFRNAFFITENNIARWASGTGSDTLSLYKANGDTGEIRRFLANLPTTSLRTSKNGRFVLFEGNIFNAEFAHVFLFDVEKEMIIGEFEWNPHRPIELERDTIQGWEIRRFDNLFKIFSPICFARI